MEATEFSFLAAPNSHQQCGPVDALSYKHTPCIAKRLCPPVAETLMRRFRGLSCKEKHSELREGGKFRVWGVGFRCREGDLHFGLPCGYIILGLHLRGLSH